MSERKSTPEPSMEEILASIRRILSEGETNVRPVPRPARAAADVLDLTEAIGDDGSVRHIEPAAIRREAATPSVHADGRVEPTPPIPDAEREGLLSTPAAGAVSASFARLATTAHHEQSEPEPALDQALRDTLRPMLQAWLDENLPSLVERLVQAEIARVVGDAGRR